MTAAPTSPSASWPAERFADFAAAELEASSNEFSWSENLITLGLGSVSLMKLRSALGQDGIDISFSDLAEAGSVEGWSALAAAAQAAPGSATDAEEGPPEPETDPHAPFALTHVQRAYWLGRSDQIELGGVAAHGYLEIECAGLDLDRLQSALNAVIAAHPMLRAVITEEGQQRVLPEVPPYQITCADHHADAPEAGARKRTRIAGQMRQQVLSFDSWPMFDIRFTRLPQDRQILHVSFDILLFDIKSLELWVTEWWRAYDDPDFVPTPPRASFRDHIRELDARSQSAEAARARAYWDARLADLPLGPELPLERPASDIAGSRFDRVQTQASAALWQKVRGIAQARGLTGSAFLMALYARVLAVWATTPEFSLTVTLFSRDSIGAELNDVIGDFTSLLPLEVGCGTHATMADLAQATQAQLWRDLDHSAMSGIEVLTALSARENTHGRALIPYVFTSGLGTGRSYLDAFSAFGRIVDAAVQTPQLLIDHQTLEFDGGLVVNWDYVAEAFAPEQIQAIADLHLKCLEALAEVDTWDDPALFADLAPTVPPLPATGPVENWQAEAAERPLFAPFRDQVLKQPHALAIVSGETRISYAALDAASSHLAYQLLEAGVTAEELVAIHMLKGWPQVVAVLAVLKAGAAYLPIDPTLPASRAQALVDQGRARILLTAEGFDSSVSAPAEITVTKPLLDRPAIAPPAAEVSPEALAYVLFTSGTTGTPKGVMIEHRAALNTCLAVNARNGIGPGDRSLQVSALHFDLSVYDLFGTLAAGGTLVIPEGETAPEPARWRQLVAQEQVTVWNSVPSLLGLLLDGAATLDLASLRHVFLSGDWLPVPLCRSLLDRLPEARLVSMGGPTEGAIWQVDFPVSHIAPQWKSIPYGWPLANQKVLILDHTLSPRPVGVAGEIYIGGAGLGRGYWDAPELTARHFITHPRTGERLYRSGDWARWSAEGHIEFLGRTDAQVKLNGVRLELGEVETTLARHPRVARAAAVVVEAPGGGKSLAAFVCPTPDADPDAAEVKDWVADRLPRACVPAVLHVLDQMPLTGNGKLDRATLLSRATAQRPVLASRPCSPAERQVLAVWTELLGRDVQDPDANFFTIGGNSLLATKLAARLSDLARASVQAIRIFELPTAAAQSALLQQEDQSPPAVTSAPRVRTRSAMPRKPRVGT